MDDASRLPRAQRIVLRRSPLLLACLASLLCLSCRTLPGDTALSVEEARAVALAFEGKYKTPPPRGYGEVIQDYVDRYGSLSPERIEECSQFVESFEDPTPSGSKDDGVLRGMARDAFLRGDIVNAVKLAHKAAKAHWGTGAKTRAYAELAIFMAETGDIDRAASAYGAARRFFNRYIVSTGATQKGVARFLITHAQAHLALARGDAQMAEILFYQAMNNFEKARKKHFIMDQNIHARLGLARALLAQGKYAEAEIWVRETLDMDSSWPYRTHFLLVLSDIFMAQGRYSQAGTMARTAVNGIINMCHSVDSFDRANAREAYARTLMAEGFWDKALEEHRRIEKEIQTNAINARRRPGDPDQGPALVMAGSRPDAKRIKEKRAYYQRRFQGNPDLGLALLMTGDPGAAIRQLDAALAMQGHRFFGDAYKALEIQGLKAMAMADAGETKAARDLFEATLPELITLWRARKRENAQDFQKQKLQLIMSAYLKIVADAGEPARIARAMAMAGALRAGVVGQALAASAARANAGDPELAALVRQRQDLEMQLTAMQNNLLALMQNPEEFQSRGSRDEFQGEIERLGEAVATLDREVQDKFPRYAALVSPAALTVEDIRAHLGPDEAFLYYFVSPRQSFVWAFQKTGPVAFAAIPKGRRALGKEIQSLRDYLSPEKVFISGDLPDFNTALSHRLYSQLLEPVATAWKPAKSLLVVPDGPLGQLPFSVLTTRPDDLKPATSTLFANHAGLPWLARSHAVTLLPSASTLPIIRSLPGGDAARHPFAGFGDPYFNPGQMASAGEKTAAPQVATRGIRFNYRGIRVASGGGLDSKKITSCTLAMLNRLPDTRPEIESIAGALKADRAGDVFLGTAASEETVKQTDLSRRKVITFATHALVPGDLDGLQEPAIALSAPAVTGGNEDGLLTMGEVMGLKLDADWVVLSACNTAAGNGAGAEAVSGLGQAFFYAGARALLVTGWPVETTSAREITTDLFTRLAEDPDLERAEALRRTITALMDKTSSAGFSYAHPIFWAPFIIVGDGR